MNARRLSIVVVLASLVLLLVLGGQTAKPAAPTSMIWTVRDVQRRSGDPNPPPGRLVSFAAAELIAIEPAGGVYAGKTYLIRGRPYPSSIVVNGEPAYWRQLWQIDVGAGHRDLSSR